MGQPAPCDECEWSGICRKEPIACADFKDYVETGTFAPVDIRSPSCAMYDKIHKNSGL